MELMIQDSKGTNPFRFGNCALIALSNAFDLKDYCAHALFIAVGCKRPTTGVTYNQCKRVINILCKTYGWEVSYSPNPEKLTYKQLAFVFTKRKYIILFDRHLSYMENGIILDSYIASHGQIDYINMAPTGWWKLN